MRVCTNGFNNNEQMDTVNRLLDTIKYIQSYVENSPVVVANESTIKALIPDAMIKNGRAYYDGIHFLAVPNEFLPEANQAYVLKYKDLFPTPFYV